MKVISWKNADFDNGTISEIKVTPLCHNSNAREMQIVMPALSALKEHKAPFDITLQVLRGEIEFRARGQSVRLGELDMVSLGAGELLLVSAVKDSIARLSMAMDAEKMKEMQTKMPPKR